MLDLRSLKKDQFITNFKHLVRAERETTAEVLEYIKEADRRKIYFDFGHTSLFSFLTKEFGYAAASAQRRIEAARILMELPEIKADLESGALNLTQVSMVAQNMRAAQKIVRTKSMKTDSIEVEQSNLLEIQQVGETHQNSTMHRNYSAEEKMELLNAVKGQDVKSSQKIISQKLDIPIQTYEQTRVQQDESVRAEIRFSKEQMQLLERVKELISHTNPNPKLSEIFEKLALFYIEKKDPQVQKQAAKKLMRPNFRSEVTQQQESVPEGMRQVAQSRPHIPIKIKREIFARDQVCQWKEQNALNICGSKFQLQLDHIQPVAHGGENESENLQLLCAVHNKRKYQLYG